MYCACACAQVCRCSETVAHNAGVFGADSLRTPRQALGIQIWRQGVPECFYELLPASVPAPCSASQIFTTVHDNEDTVRAVAMGRAGCKLSI
jgi:hypothetical protein